MFTVVYRPLSLVFLALLLALSIPTSTAFAEDFNVMSIGEKSDQATPVTVIIVEGGYRKGLYEAMTGRVRGITNRDDTLDLGTATIVEVAEKRALCSMPKVPKDVAVRKAKVSFDLVELTSGLCVERGHAALAGEQFERAHFYFSQALALDSLGDSGSIQTLIDSAVVLREKQRIQKLTEEKRVHGNGALSLDAYIGMSCLNEGKIDSAEVYFGRALKADKREKLIRNNLERIRKIRKYYSEQSDQNVIDWSIPDSLSGKIDKDTKPADTYPEIIKQAEPDYPSQAKENGIAGETWVNCLIDKNGKVAKVVVHITSGSTILDNAAVLSAYKREYKPAMSQSEPTDCWIAFAVAFELEP